MSDAIGERASKPFWAKCGACAHAWPAAYFPMDLTTFAKIVLAASKFCPKCGSKNVLVAKQDEGVLTEPGGAARP